MTPRTAIVAAAFFHLLTVAPHGQDRSDFSGRWTLVQERSVIQGPDGPIILTVFGTDFTVHREADTLVVSVAPDVAPTWRVNLDGTPTLHASGPDDQLVRTTVTTAWEGETLVMHMAVEEVRNGQLLHSRTRRCLTLNPDHTLRVEMPDGEDGRMIASVYRWLEAIP